MNAKPIIRIVLLAVIGIAVGSWAVKEFAPTKAGAETIRPDGVTVISFHGEKRCRTCIKIGDLAKRTLDDEYAEAQQAGKLRWEHINYEEPANAHFVKDYELVSSTIVITRWKDGKELGWKRLDAVWDHVGDEPVFRTYVAGEVRKLLENQ